MAHYAFLDDKNIVIEVIAGIDENQLIDGIAPEQWYGVFRNKKCVRTSYNGKIRKQFAGIGYFYDETLDIFIAPQPYPSWTLNKNGDWVAPIPYPEFGSYLWNEDLGDWVNAETL